MANLDYLQRRADILAALDEQPDRDYDIVEGLYGYFVAVRGRQPEPDEFRAYVHHISSSFEWRDPWELFSPHSPLTEEEKAARLGRVAPGMAAGTAAPPRFRPGRPGWTPELFWARYDEACERAAPPHTYRSVAQHFVALDGAQGTSPEYLRKLVRRFGRQPR